MTILTGVHDEGRADLMDVGLTLDHLGLLPGPGQRRQQNGDQKGNDGHDHQYLDERESAISATWTPACPIQVQRVRCHAFLSSGFGAVVAKAP
jgi:hypothetical protein